MLAFEQLDTLLDEGLDHLAKNRNLMATSTDELRQSGLLDGEIPNSGCLYFPRWRGRTDLDIVAQRLKDDFGVLISPGRFFGDGCKDHLRIGFGGGGNVVCDGLERLSRGMRAMA